MARRKRKRPHGTGSVRLRGGRAQVQWTDPDGTRRTRTVDLAEYQAFLARACGGLECTTKSAPTQDLAALAATWLSSRADMASIYDDQNRWKNHVGPALGHLTPEQVTVPVLKALIQGLKAKGLSKGTVRLCIALVSSLFGDLVEDGTAKFNPVRMLSRKTRQNELTPDQDWKKTPFIRNPADINRIYQSLLRGHPGVALAYAIGALAGLRTGEVRALEWQHIDYERRVIHVRQQIDRRTGQVKDLLKSGESRFVPLTDSLREILVNQPYRLEAADSLVCGKLSEHTIGGWIRCTLSALELPAMRWYEATRHTFASQWVLNGGSLETLRDIMGHSSVTVTERYAHLVPGLYSAADRGRVVVELVPDVHAADFVN